MIIRLALLLALSGCSPYLGYQHLSDPRIANDGYDLVCAGGEKQVKGLRADAAVCNNVNQGNTMIRADIRYVWER